MAGVGAPAKGMRQIFVLAFEDVKELFPSGKIGERCIAEQRNPTPEEHDELMAAWRRLGIKYGFDPLTVIPVTNQEAVQKSKEGKTECLILAMPKLWN